MFKNWYDLTMYSCKMANLAAESQQVIWLRMMKLGAGGPAAQQESLLMVSEKAQEAMKAAGSLAAGKSPTSVINSYTRKVRANKRRLSK